MIKIYRFLNYGGKANKKIIFVQEKILKNIILLIIMPIHAIVTLNFASIKSASRDDLGN